VLVASLVAIATASIVQGLSGAELIAVPFNLTGTLVAAAVVIWSRKPTSGLIVDAWLSLGWVFMPTYKVDHLRDPANTGIFVGSLLQLLANTAALASGAAAEREYRRRLQGVPEPASKHRVS
jgi:hypothetical protein